MSARRVLVLLGLVGGLAWADLPNLGQIKTQIVQWHDSGAYDQEIGQVDAQAQVYLSSRLGDSGKLAMVLDIDETSLSNWPYLVQYDFAYVPDAWLTWEHMAAAWPIQPTLSLFRYAETHHVAVFFVSSRPETERQYTVRNLQSAGYGGYQALYLRGPDDPQGDSVMPFKSSVRKRIVGQGYDIVLSVGDQMSDLEGGYADKTFKLPNPMYFIP